MATKKASSYSADDIVKLSAREAVQQKTSMYIGSVDEVGAFTCLRETTDNIQDEASNGFCSVGGVLVLPDNEYYVYDDGRGMPVGLKEIEDDLTGSTTKISALRAITSMMHAGGKMSESSKAYQGSIGSHGVGQKATNFLSLFFKVYTFSSPNPKSQKAWYSIEYENGILTKDVAKCATPKSPFSGKPIENGGTLIHFKLDPQFFTSVNFPEEMITSYMKLSSYFLPKFKFLYINRVTKAKHVFQSKNGFLDYVSEYLEDKKYEVLSEEIFTHSDSMCSTALCFTNLEGFHVKGFTNGLYNQEGGTHISSLLKALKTSLEPYIKKGKDFTETELKDGLVGVISVRLSAPKFSSQVKVKLKDDRADKPLQDQLLPALKQFFKENKKLALDLCERCSKLKDLRSKFLHSKAVVTELNKAKKKGLPSKALVASGAPSSKRELFIIEGDSAKGSCENARFHEYQEVYPLRGKIGNAFRMSPAKILASEEIIGVLAMLGYDPKAEDPYSKLRVSKLFIMADADPDGFHIAALVLCLIKKYLPELISRGMVYTVNVPEYYAEYKGKHYISHSKSGMRDLLRKIGAPESKSFKHFKGLGEMEWNILRMYGMDPKSRLVTRVELSDEDDAENKLVNIMSGDAGIRRELLGIEDSE